MFLILKRKKLRSIFIFITIFSFFILGIWGLKSTWNLKIASALARVQTVIVIDAGHGGRDPGAVSGNIYEKDINLDVAKRLKRALVHKGYKVFMTRTEDTNLVNWQDRGSYQRASLWQRVQVSNKRKAAILISIHCNSSLDKTYFGPQTFYYKESLKGKKLAISILEELKKIRATKRQANSGDYYLLINSDCTAVIVELGYLSNAKDLALLTSANYREKMAQGIANGIVKQKN